ncbi:hypothetical protein HERIO_2597 [Hepatospora eriocheir]|uniref:N-acetylglucosaminylphosphatidylinositol deacetylase n=1 Tax=Hepatospora eriocheir TaxID=1081669 RepID=A0A1X0Q6A3_9MICR|nr:hypothetical protein HERIO_2597 [Hepatospora eriocheir]
MKVNKYKKVILFDEKSVSDHSNHISCYKLVSELEKKFKSIKYLYLKTVNLYKKYLILMR